MDPTTLDGNDSDRAEREGNDPIPSSSGDSEDSTAGGHNQGSASSDTQLTSETGSEEKYDQSKPRQRVQANRS